MNISYNKHIFTILKISGHPDSFVATPTKTPIDAHLVMNGQHISDYIVKPSSGKGLKIKKSKNLDFKQKFKVMNNNNNGKLDG